MNVREYSVKEWHFSFVMMSGRNFRIQAETKEKALKKLATDLKSV